MMIRRKRLEAMLETSGFQFLYEDSGTHDLAFVRSSSMADLFESIHVVGQGRNGEAVYAILAISILRHEFGVVSELFSVQDPLLELGRNLPGHNAERRWTIIKNQDDALAWEKELARILPDGARQLTDREGSALLQRTATIRRTANQYVSFLDGRNGLEEEDERLDALISDEVRREAERMQDTPGLVWISGKKGERLYRLAIRTILLYGERVESIPRAFWGKVPLGNNELMGRIQLLVDLLDIRDRTVLRKNSSRGGSGDEGAVE